MSHGQAYSGWGSHLVRNHQNVMTTWSPISSYLHSFYFFVAVHVEFFSIILMLMMLTFENFPCLSPHAKYFVYRLSHRIILTLRGNVPGTHGKFRISGPKDVFYFLPLWAFRCDTFHREHGRVRLKMWIGKRIQEKEESKNIRSFPYFFYIFNHITKIFTNLLLSPKWENEDHCQLLWAYTEEVGPSGREVVSEYG